VELHEGQVAVVTGAASGIGLGIARAFAGRGLHVVLADVEGAALAEAARAIAESGGSGRSGASRGPGATDPSGTSGPTLLAVETDVSDADQVDALAQRTLDRFGRVDVVCNNAGVTVHNKATWEMDELDWQWVLGVNLWGVIHGIHTFVPLLVDQNRGHVVNTASIVGLSYGPEIAPYTASKHAVVAISETMRGELATRAPGVGVTVLCPSYVPTRIGEAERNRPPDLTPDWSVAVRGTPRDRSSLDPVPPDAVGEMVVGAVESGRFYLSTHAGVASLLRHRFDAIMKEVS
jgi:NAD(P)-dependent dehydrogenase (short-subunit alcohol dehydrogenase family)